MATAIGHGLLGLFLFWRPLADVIRGGLFNTISPSPFDPTFDRECAFWFLAFSPMLFVLGRIAGHAVEWKDGAVLRLIGGTVGMFGVVGALVMPASGQWILILLGALTIRAAQRLERRSQT